MTGGKRQPVVGVTGLPCSGKSWAARLLADGKITGEPGELVKADDIGHAVLAFPEAREAIRARFGEGVVCETDERETRRRLAGRVFADPADLAWLEGLVHPLVERETEKVIRAAAGERMVVVEAALLFAAGMDAMCDAVVLVEAERETRLRRALARGWNAEEMARRERRLVSLFAPERLAALGDKLIRVRNDADDGGMAERLRGEWGRMQG